MQGGIVTPGALLFAKGSERVSGSGERVLENGLCAVGMPLDSLLWTRRLHCSGGNNCAAIHKQFSDTRDS